jgi:uncharacterized protein (UPF0264 family)
MSRYLIAYDGSSETTDYNALEDFLVTLGAKHIQMSVWGLRSQDTAKNIFNKIWPMLDEVDSSLIVLVAGYGKEQNSIEPWSDI